MNNTVSKVVNYGKYHVDYTIDDSDHKLKIKIKRESCTDGLSFAVEDKIINFQTELQENILNQGIYHMFHKKAKIRLLDCNDEYSEFCSSIVQITTCPIEVNSHEPIPGLVVEYKMYLMKDLPAIYITTSFEGSQRAFCCNLNWMNIVPAESGFKEEYKEFFGIEPYMHGELNEILYPIAFRKGINLVGNKFWFGVISSSNILMNPNDCSLTPDYELRSYYSDLRYLSSDRCLSAWLVFGEISEDKGYSHEEYQVLSDNLTEIACKIKRITEKNKYGKFHEIISTQECNRSVQSCEIDGSSCKNNESYESYSLKSGILEVVFKKRNSGVFLSEIKNHGFNYNNGANCNLKLSTFLNQKLGPLFDACILDLETGQKHWIDSDSGWENVVIRNENEYISLAFENPGNGKFKDLTVLVKGWAVSSENRIEWTVDVLNDSNRISVLSVTYPNIFFQGENLDIFVPVNCGELINDCCSYSTHLYGSYPSGGTFVMPYFAIYASSCDYTDSCDNAARDDKTEGNINPNRNNISFNYNNTNYKNEELYVNNGLYVAVHDDRGSRKDISLNTFGNGKQGILSFSYPAVNYGEAANAFSLPGCMVWQIFSGDWYDATLIYKSFVHNYAKWIPKVGNEGREDTPLWMREVPFWIMDWMPNDNPDADPIPISVRPEKEETDRDSWYKNPLLLREKLGVPCGYHVYNWHWIPFNNDYPHYFPTKAGFTEGVKIMEQNDIHVMPYINGRIWDTKDRRDQDYQFSSKAKQGAVKKESGELSIETYASHEPDGTLVKLATMCPSSHIWKKTIENIAKKLFNECGVSAIYIDQIAAAYSNLCMDKSHNHLPGGGSWWVEAYWNFMNRVNGVKPANCIYTSESNAEVYVKSFDGYLTWIWINSNQVPAFPAIYSGYIAMLGRNTNGYKKKDVTYFKYHVSQQILYGQQIGWINSDIVYHEEKLSYLIKMVRLRWDYRRFFYKGTLLRPPKIVDDVPHFVTIPGMRFPRVFDVPVVSAGAWRLWDNSRSVLFMFNIGDEDISFTCEFNTDEYFINDINDLCIASGSGRILEANYKDDKTIQLKCMVSKSDYLAIEW